MKVNRRQTEAGREGLDKTDKSETARERQILASKTWST